MEDFVALLDEIWDSHWITNRGPLHERLREALATRMAARHVQLVANGTLAIQLALRALRVRGKVVTTPFTFPATVNAVLWEGLEPVFADIDPDHFGLAPDAVGDVMGDDVGAILAVHVYGQPCDVRGLARVAHEHGVPLLYDAAHAFGVEVEGRPVTGWGSASTLSFHATKVFHTGEGGAVVAQEASVAERVALLANHGIQSETEFLMAGTNGKMSELHAAMGLANLARLDACLRRRALLEQEYRAALRGADVVMQRTTSTKTNHAYMPILLRDEAARERVFKALQEEGVKARRYFFPLVSEAPYLASGGHFPVARDVSTRVLCLPMYSSLPLPEVGRIAAIIHRATV